MRAAPAPRNSSAATSKNSAFAPWEWFQEVGAGGLHHLRSKREPKTPPAGLDQPLLRQYVGMIEGLDQAGGPQGRWGWRRTRQTCPPPFQQAEQLVQGGGIEVAGQIDPSLAGHHQRHAAGSAHGKGIGLRCQLEADPTLSGRVSGCVVLALPQLVGAAERSGVQMVLLAEVLQALVAAELVLYETTYLGTAAAYGN